jgi:hypothetical protein
MIVTPAGHLYPIIGPAWPALSTDNATLHLPIFPDKTAARNVTREWASKINPIALSQMEALFGLGYGGLQNWMRIEMRHGSLLSQSNLFKRRFSGRR